MINKAKLELEVIGWTESDFKRLYPNFDKDLSRVNFLGKKSHEYTLKRLGVSDGLISISDHEAMPLNIIEALLLSTPIFVKPQSGYEYFLENFQTVKTISSYCSLLERPSEEN